MSGLNVNQDIYLAFLRDHADQLLESGDVPGGMGAIEKLRALEFKFASDGQDSHWIGSEEVKDYLDYVNSEKADKLGGITEERASLKGQLTTPPAPTQRSSTEQKNWQQEAAQAADTNRDGKISRDELENPNAEFALILEKNGVVSLGVSTSTNGSGDLSFRSSKTDTFGLKESLGRVKVQYDSSFQNFDAVDIKVTPNNAPKSSVRGME